MRSVEELLKEQQEKLRLRQEAHRKRVEACPGHDFEPWVYWSGSGRVCKLCLLSIKDKCHYVGCKCGLPHSTDKKEGN